MSSLCSEVVMYGDERERTFNRYNMRLLDGVTLSKDGFEMPMIKKTMQKCAA